MTPKETYSFRIDPKVKAKLLELAEKKKMRHTTLANSLIEKGLEEL